MTICALFLEAAAGGQAQQIAKTFGVDWPHLLAQITSFCIVCFLLQRYAYKPILAVLDQRRRQIAQGIADAQQIKSQLVKTEAERHEILMEAGAEAAKIIEEARVVATQVQRSETEKAVAAAEQIVSKAQEAAVQEHTRMLGELKGELGLLVVQATTLVTGKVLTSGDQRRMAEETIKQVGKAA